MKINTSLYCPQCNEVFEKAKVGISDCPCCTNRNNIFLYVLIFERNKPKKEGDIHSSVLVG